RAAWLPAATPSTLRDGAAATLLPTGQVLVSGGNDGTNVLATAEIYDAVAGVWTGTGPMNAARDSHTGTLLPNGNVLVAGGFDGSNALSSTETYDPSARTWSTS